jgi:HPt (histidine-containing phosphotransfer) domain-containing protein
MQALRRRFLDEGVEGVREFMAKLEGGFPADEAARSMHQWIGTGGMLGYAAISRLAAEAEAVLAARPADNARLRELLGELAAEFEDSAGE